jgi:hypothetical protein
MPWCDKAGRPVVIDKENAIDLGLTWRF